MIRTLERHRSARARRGTSMVVTTVLVFSLAGISVSLTAMSRSAAGENRTARDETNAYYVAQAGLAEAVQDMRTGGTGAVGAQGNRREFGGAAFWVDSVDLGNGVRSLVATGIDQNVGARIELVMQQTGLPFFRFGAFGELGLTLDSNATIDSYDSSLGTYASQVASQNGNSGSNRDIHLRQNSRIHGAAQPGPGNTVTILGNAVVTGATTPSPTEFELPPIEFPVPPGGADFTASGTVTWAPGLHNMGSLRLDSNAILNITGPATIVCTGMDMRSNSQVIINATQGPVEFYVDGDFRLLSNAQIYSTDYIPSNVSLFLNGDNIIDPDVEVQLQEDELVFNSNTKVWGTMYAPNAFVEIDSNFELFGSMIARQLHIDSNARIHFDEALLEPDEETETTLQALLWRRRPFSMSELGE